MDEEAQMRELAWIGDAVLSLYVRQWLLQSTHLDMQQRADYFIRMTSNNFLTALGKPTEIEARIGKRFEEEGLPAAYAYIHEHIASLFMTQLKNKKLPLPHAEPPKLK